MPTKPTHLRISPDLLSRIDAAAKDAGASRTAWILEACERRLGRDEALAPVLPTFDAELSDGPGAAMRFRCPRDCDPQWRPTSSNARCPHCRSATVPA